MSHLWKAPQPEAVPEPLFARCAELLDRVVPDLLRDMVQFLTDLPGAPVVTVPQAYLLRHLQSRPLTASQIAELLCISSGPVTSLTRRLIQRGYVERRQDQADRRVVWFHLTDKGRQAIEALVGARRAKWEALLRQLGPAWAQTTVDVMAAMHDAVRQMRHPASDPGEIAAAGHADE
ncbi:MAG: MarR family transcriptional regulator [Alicyclobacillaceae bacterium]|nr:MarR family transcriptional regulator [Alicyclobacillaceae bacterium]